RLGLDTHVTPSIEVDAVPAVKTQLLMLDPVREPVMIVDTHRSQEAQPVQLSAFLQPAEAEAPFHDLVQLLVLRFVACPPFVVVVPPAEKGSALSIGLGFFSGFEEISGRCVNPRCVAG